MDEISTGLTRRHLFIAGSLATVAVAGLAEPAAAMSAGEKANAKVVREFIAAWNDPDKAVTYLSDDASVRMVEGKPPVVGPAAVDAAFKGFMTPGTKLSVKILSTTAEGPIVMNRRIDTLTMPGKPAQSFKVVGVFVVKKGKITEWADYLDA